MPRWTESLSVMFRSPPGHGAVRQAQAPPVLPIDEALTRINRQALADLAERREAGLPRPQAWREEPPTWDDIEQSLRSRLAAYRTAPKALILQLGVEVQKPVPWWRQTGRGLDEYLDRPFGWPVARSFPATAIDELVFGELYVVSGQYAPRGSESLGDVRRAFRIDMAFALSPNVPLRWASRLCVVQVVAALEQQRADHVLALQLQAEAEGESGGLAYDMWHNRHAESAFMTRALARRVLRARSVTELTDELVCSIPWLVDHERTEQQLRGMLSTPVARPAIRR